MIVTFEDLTLMTMGFTLEYFSSGQVTLLMYRASAELLNMLVPTTNLWFLGKPAYCTFREGFGPNRTEVRLELRTLQA